MKAHKAMHQLRNIVLELLAAEQYTTAPTCIEHIRRAKDEVYRVADILGIELVTKDVMQ